METFLALPAKRRAELFELAADQLGVSAGAVEKDFWVCWVLRELFDPAAGLALTFKGGTSLSKCWNLIERFSEDIDLVVGREAVGLPSFDAREVATSRRAKEAQRASVQTACRPYVQASIYPCLEAAVRRVEVTAGPLELAFDPDDEAGQNLHLTYTSPFTAAGYLRPVVKIEPGALSDTEPVRSARVRPYVAIVTPDELRDLEFEVKSVAPERTFWEKVCLLHEEAYKTGDVRGRLARHYYDLWCLDQKGVAQRALADRALFERVVEHRREFFPRAAEIQDTLTLGSMRLVPAEGRRAAWRADFTAMSETMFFGTPPTFEEVMVAAARLEKQMSLLASTGS